MGTIEEQEDQWFKDLEIDDSSPFALNEELKHHSQKAAHWQREYAHAVKKVGDLNLKLEVLVATIIQELCEEAEGSGRPIPQTARGELRKNKVPLDNRYQDARRELNEAIETRDLLKALAQAFGSRSGRLRDMSQLMENLMRSNPRLFNKTGPRTSTKMKHASEKLDYGEET